MKDTGNRDKKSPLKEAPLRLPGQSLDEMLEKRWEECEPYWLLAVFAVVMALIEWWQDWRKLPRIPSAYAVVAFVFVG